jgi:hypothetical protein
MHAQTISKAPDAGAAGGAVHHISVKKIPKKPKYMASVDGVPLKTSVLYSTDPEEFNSVQEAETAAKRSLLLKQLTP